MVFAAAGLKLLNEPSIGLSPILIRDIYTIIRRLNRERGVAMLLVEQNARVALDVADFGYVMEIGRIVMDGPAERLAQSRDIREFYLGGQERSLGGERRWKRRKTWRWSFVREVRTRSLGRFACRCFVPVPASFRMAARQPHACGPEQAPLQSGASPR